MDQHCTPAAARIQTIDAIRGVAVLGILLMNITGFAFHPAAYADPTIQGGASGADLWTFIINAVLVDGKMRGMFTILFGAGICLFTARADDRGAGIEAADIYYRRYLWLLAAGLAHAYLLWWGEVLFPYALLALVLFPFRVMSPKRLIAIVSILTVLMTAGAAFDHHEATAQHAAYNTVQALEKQGRKPTPEQAKASAAWQERLKFMKPDAEAIERNHTANTQNLITAIRARHEVVAFFHHLPIYSPMLWDFLAMMFLGMALLKTGVLTAERSSAFYWKLAAAGYAIGLPLHAAQLHIQLTSWFSIESSILASVFFQPARIAVTLGHLALWMLLFKHNIFPALTRTLAATGQMALTNYVMQSVICTLVFNVLHLHGTRSRHQVYYIVFAVWLAQLAWSPIWLATYRFGPFEWAWRSLTYWTRQPFRRAPAPPIQPADQQPTVVN